jgi:hypothetical protein
MNNPYANKLPKCCALLCPNAGTHAPPDAPYMRLCVKCAEDFPGSQLVVFG